MKKLSNAAANGSVDITLDDYLHAATRENTRKSYRSAVEHFETAWGGMLPTTSEEIARYLVAFADKHSAATLRQRLTGLAAWHQQQGFADPTKTPYVKKVLKGIAELHPTIQKQAKPIELQQLQLIVNSLEQPESEAASSLTALRNRSLLLMGFWRAFRSDELSRVRVEHIQVEPGRGMTINIPRSKGDRGVADQQGRQYFVPTLRQLCPVTAYQDWQQASGVTSGPVFRKIDRWGNVGSQELHPSSITHILRQCCRAADINNAEAFSSHSLRRGFANWANRQGWDIKSLMEYVGWRDVKSALRYVDGTTPFAPEMLLEQSQAELD